MTEVLLSIIAGLVLFLFSANNLSETIQLAISDSANKWILKFTLYDSCSAIIIITIVLVNSKILTFKQAPNSGTHGF